MNEGLPLTVLEAMSYKKIVLLSDIPEHLELITDKRATFSENSVSAIERAFESFFALTDEEKNEMSSTNLKKVLVEFDWDVISKDVESVYENQNNNVRVMAKSAQA